MPTYYPLPPSAQRQPQLLAAWDQKLRDCIELPDPGFSPEEKERHSFYALLVLALTSRFWCGNKYGSVGKYGSRNGQKVKAPQPGAPVTPDSYEGGDYLGHNIACIAVDGRGRVLDFDFNHNEVFDSSVDHAEARLVRRLFSLAGLNVQWATQVPGTPPGVNYANTLSNVTIYTSLESCSQCSGIMALGQVPQVVYLQSDPGQYAIGNLIYNLSQKIGVKNVPRPIPAACIGLNCMQELDAGFAQFLAEQDATPFFLDKDGKPRGGTSITSYLCTDHAKKIFDAAKVQLLGLTDASYPGYPGTVGVLTNSMVLREVKDFFAYADKLGSRGTPHR